MYGQMVREATAASYKPILTTKFSGAERAHFLDTLLGKWLRLLPRLAIDVWTGGMEDDLAFWKVNETAGLLSEDVRFVRAEYWLLGS